MVSGVVVVVKLRLAVMYYKNGGYTLEMVASLAWLG